MAGSEFDNEPLYEPLHTIRLLRLIWGKDSSGFDAYLVSFALNSASCPEFVALSYTWGDPAAHSKSINVNGHRFEILDSLYPFLKLAPMLPEFSSETWWWIDSICINQKDEKEKSSQIGIMGEIYQRADKTVVWLGEEVGANFDDDSKDCTGAIANLYQLCNKFDALDRKGRSYSALFALREPGSGIDWKAIERLLLRPWWRRVWTLQEFLISNRLSFYCGKRSISRQNLEDAVYVMWHCKGSDGQLMDANAFWGAWGRRRIDQWRKERKHEMGLIAMMAYVGQYAATDERDRIYSLLGVARDANMVRPHDHKSSIDVIYTELVTSFLAEHNSLDIICYAHLFNSSATKLDTKPLPSWVPDWRAHVEGRVIPVMASQGSKSGTGNFRPIWVKESEAKYSASADTNPQVRISDDLQILSCRGIFVDKLDGLGGLTHNDRKRPTPDLKNDSIPFVLPTSNKNLHSTLTNTSVNVLMATLSRCIALDREDRYLADSMAPDRFQADFETLCEATLETPGVVPTRFRDWFQLNKSFVICGRTLEKHCQAAHRSGLSLTRQDFKHGSLGKFYGRFDDTTEQMVRRLAVTENGYLGMAACRARKGDVICVLFGCSIPVLLREQEGGTYQFIGECYLDGFMNGEALDKRRGFAEVEFRII